MLLSEIYDVLDCIVIDNATISSHNDIWSVTSQSGLIFERKEEYTEFSITTATNKYVLLNQTLSDCIIEMDIYLTTDGTFFDILNSNGERVARSVIGVIGTVNTWIPIKIIFNNGTITLTNTNTSASSVIATNVEYTTFRWLNFANTSHKLWFKNFKLYPI